MALSREIAPADRIYRTKMKNRLLYMIQVFCYKSTKPERGVYHASLFLYSLPERDRKSRARSGA